MLNYVCLSLSQKKVCFKVSHPQYLLYMFINRGVGLQVSLTVHFESQATPCLYMTGLELGQQN